MDWKVVAAAPLVIENQLPIKGTYLIWETPKVSLVYKAARACASWLCSLHDRGCLQSCSLSEPVATCCLVWDHGLSQLTYRLLLSACILSLHISLS
jgi:hypothetical protein